jgi:hypothetical protein
MRVLYCCFDLDRARSAALTEETEGEPERFTREKLNNGKENRMIKVTVM